MTSPEPAEVDAARLRIGRNYLLMLLSPFTFFVTAIAAFVMALGGVKSADSVERRHTRFQVRVLLSAGAWIVLAVLFAMSGSGRMGGHTFVHLAGGNRLLYAAVGCLVASAVWCAAGALIGLSRLMSGVRAEAPTQS